MTSKKAIGLIINPMAGRDIRRLVAFASLQSGPEKALVAKRIIAGMTAVSGIEVLLPDDRSGFFAWLKSELGNTVPIRLVPLPRIEEDSTVLWTGHLVEAGANALIVVGGDGTQRNVAQAHPPVPVLPIAGGTNNVACYLGDQTAGGYAVARYLADQRDPEEVGDRSKVCHIQLPSGHEELALIDVALTRQNYTGAMAIWDPRDVRELVLAVADPVRPGLSNVGGYREPISFSEDAALHLILGEGEAKTSAVLAPGLMADFFVTHCERIALDVPVVLSCGEEGGSLTLDGERTVVLHKEQYATVSVRRDGPLVLNPERILSPS